MSLSVLHRSGLFAVSALIIGVILTGCGEKNSVPDAHVRTVIAEKIPQGWSVTQFSVEVTENLGTKALPRIVKRFKGEVTANEDFFVRGAPSVQKVPQIFVQEVNSHLFVRKVTDKGTKAPIFGTTESIRHGDGWRTTVNFESPLGFTQGHSRDRILSAEHDGSRFIVVGSNEEKAYFEDIEKRFEAHRRAEEVRLATLRKPFVDYFADGVAALGVARHSSRGSVSETPVTVRLNVEESSNKVSGTIVWESSNARKWVEGRFIELRTGGLAIELSEVRLHNPEDADPNTFVGLDYRFVLDQNDSNVLLGIAHYRGQRFDLTMTRVTLN